jgi:hypothetical protein
VKPYRIIEGAEPIASGTVGQSLKPRSSTVWGLLYGLAAIAMAVLMLYGGLRDVFEF